MIWSDFGLGAQAPDVGPPGAVWSCPQGGAVFFESKVPSGLRGGTQFAMDFFCVVMVAKFFEQSVGLREGGDLLGGEDRREAFLPEVVRALDLAFGLRGGSVAQRNLVKAQSAAELRESVWLTGEEEGMVVDVEGQWEAVLAKGGWEEVEMSRKIFAFVNARA